MVCYYRKVTNTHRVGDLTEAIVMAELLKVYQCVLLPFGNGRRYDLVVDDGERFLRVQCKTGRLRRGCVLFNARSTHWHRGGKDHGYRGQVEFFGIYCPETEMVYLVPAEDVTESIGSLRIEPTGNNQQQGIRWAKQYELRSEVPRLLSDNGEHINLVG